MRDLKQDFWEKYLENTINTVRDYIRLLDRTDQHLKKFDVLDNQPYFERILDYLHHEAQREQIKVDPIDTLYEFTDANPS